MWGIGAGWGLARWEHRHRKHGMVCSFLNTPQMWSPNKGCTGMMDYHDECVCTRAQGGQSVCPAGEETFPKQPWCETSHWNSLKRRFLRSHCCLPWYFGIWRRLCVWNWNISLPKTWTPWSGRRNFSGDCFHCGTVMCNLPVLISSHSINELWSLYFYSCINATEN